MRKFALCVLMLAAVQTRAQQIDLKSPLEKLEAIATQVTQVNLDESTLKFAANFLSDNNPQEAAAKKISAGLKGVYVRVYSFAQPGTYSPEDLNSLRDSLKTAQWIQIAGVRNSGAEENSEVWMRREGGNATGMVLLAARPREVTVVNLAGPIRPEDLATLSGQFGIPNFRQWSPAQEGGPRQWSPRQWNSQPSSPKGADEVDAKD